MSNTGEFNNNEISVVFCLRYDLGLGPSGWLLLFLVFAKPDASTDYVYRLSTEKYHQPRGMEFCFEY